MSLQQIYVRITRGKTNTTFHRAGMTFTKEWLCVGVDEATASCLYAEQMLEVSETDPEMIEAVEAVRPEPVEGFEASSSTNSGVRQAHSSGQTVEGQQVVEQDAVDTVKKKGKS
jgi:hypothetical protein